jgi:hypothetical protein
MISIHTGNRFAHDFNKYCEEVMKQILFLVFLLALSNNNKAQLSPLRGDYYSVDATTPKVVFQDDIPNVSFNLESGTIIKIKMIEGDKVYFQVTKDTGNIKKESLYYISSPDFTEKYFSPKFSVRSGILVSPFKYRPDKGKFYPGGNLAAAGSFSYNILGIGIQPMFFAGIAAISVDDINEGKANVETKWGFTTGWGINFDVLDSMNLGVVTGWDLIDKNWDSNGRMWLAFSLNFKFIE